MQKIQLAFAAILLVPAFSLAAPKDQVCPKQEEAFEPFLKHFSEDAKFRSTRIVYPLVVRSGDLRLGPPEIEIWSESTVASLSHPLILSARALKKQALEQSITV